MRGFRFRDKSESFLLYRLYNSWIIKLIKSVIFCLFKRCIHEGGKKGEKK